MKTTHGIVRATFSYCPAGRLFITLRQHICNAPASLGDKKLQILVQSWFMTWHLTNKHRILPSLRWTNFPTESFTPQLISCTALHLGIGYVYAFCQCMMTACPLPHTHRQLSKAVLRRTWLLGFPHSETRLHTPWSCMYRRRKSPTVSI